ncbi:hypothetical protein [Rhodanobacter lindaniclasticus]
MGNARIIPANPKGIFLPGQTRWINDRSRLKLGEQIAPGRLDLDVGLYVREAHQPGLGDVRPMGIEPRGNGPALADL